MRFVWNPNYVREDPKPWAFRNLLLTGYICAGARGFERGTER
jgi:hypothetical protein